MWENEKTVHVCVHVVCAVHVCVCVVRTVHVCMQYAQCMCVGLSTVYMSEYVEARFRKGGTPSIYP